MGIRLVVSVLIIFVLITQSRTLDKSPLSGIQITPYNQAIVLLGQTISIDIYCPSQRYLCIKLIPNDKEHTSALFKYSPEVSCFRQDLFNNSGKYVQFKVLGMKPGRQMMKVLIFEDGNINGTVGLFYSNYEIIVAEQFNVIHDAFIYILGSIQFLALLLFGLRMRGAATKEILLKPCSLILALLCQVICVPLISLGISLALHLDQLPTVTLLLVACSPTAVVTCMMAVIQQAHVELAVVLLHLQTLTALGTMPGWLFTYGHVLGVAYSEVSFPYFHICAAIGAIALPTLIGVALRRCTPRVLPQLDKAIHPSSLLVVMVAVTISIYNFMEKWPLITWRLLLATGLIPLVSMLAGAVLCAIFREKIPQTKTVAMVTSLQNTLLTATIIQTSYPLEKSSVMAVTLACLDFMTLGSLFVLYLVHIVLWVTWSMYRMHHDNMGISGISKSFSEKLVRNMLRAGEIRFCSRANNKRKQESANDNMPLSDVTNSAANGKRYGHMNIDKHVLTNNNRIRNVGMKLGGLNLAFWGITEALKKKDVNRADCSISVDSESDLSLQYFATPNASPYTSRLQALDNSRETMRETLSIRNSVTVSTNSESNTINNQDHTLTTQNKTNKHLPISCNLQLEPAKQDFEANIAVVNTYEEPNAKRSVLENENRYENCTRGGHLHRDDLCLCAEDDVKHFESNLSENDIQTEATNEITHDKGHINSTYDSVLACGNSIGLSEINVAIKENNININCDNNITMKVDMCRLNGCENIAMILDEKQSANNHEKEQSSNNINAGPVGGINERILDHIDPTLENQMNEQSEAECSIWLEDKM